MFKTEIDCCETSRNLDWSYVTRNYGLYTRVDNETLLLSLGIDTYNDVRPIYNVLFLSQNGKWRTVLNTAISTWETAKYRKFEGTVKLVQYE